MASYAAEYGADATRWQFLTSEPEQIKDVLAGRWDLVMSNIDTLAEERYQNYRLKDGPVHQHLIELFDWAQHNEVTVFLAATPLHEAWRKRIPNEVWSDYQAHLAALQADYGVQIFQSTAPGWSKTRKRFIDPDHLSDDGSKRFTAELCTSIFPVMGE